MPDAASSSLTSAPSRGATPDEPFKAFAAEVQAREGLRAAIDSAHRPPEPECVPALIEAASLSAPIRAQAQALARQLVEKLRARPTAGLVQGLMREYALS